MSLINEALKRARDEAVRREASTKGIPLAPSGPIRERNRWLPILVLGLTLALVVSLVVTVNLASKLPEVVQTAPAGNSARVESMTEVEIEPDSSATTESAPNTPVTVQLDPSPTGVDSDHFAAQSPPGVQPPPAQQSSSAHPTPPARLPASTAAETEIVESPPLSVVQEPASATSHGPAETEGRVFVRQVELEGGQSVDLGGIAWSEAGPYALLNGRVVGLGEWVQGYRVSKIDPAQVILERDDDRVVLRLK